MLYDSRNVLVALDWRDPALPILGAWRLPDTIDNGQGVVVAGCGDGAALFLAMDNDGLAPYLAAFRFPVFRSRCSSLQSIPLPPPDL